MNELNIGNTGMRLSQLGLGCINFGTVTAQDTAFSLIDTYLENGGNYLDTANNYAFWNGDADRPSERTIGKWNDRNPLSRRNIHIGTKLGALPRNGSKDFSDLQGTGRTVIFSEVQKSLEALRTDYIDILFLHIDDRNTPIEETMDALRTVMEKGYVKAIGCSNFRTWRIEQYRNVCREKSLPFFSAVQQRNSYFKPASDADFGVQVSADGELKDYLACHADMTLFSHTSLLYGAYTRPSINDSAYDTRENREKLRKLQQVQDRIPFVLREISKEFGGNIVLSTTSSVAHLKENIRLF